MVILINKNNSSDEILEINEINNKCVDLILEDNTIIALKLLKKAFNLIEVKLFNLIEEHFN